MQEDGGLSKEMLQLIRDICSNIENSILLGQMYPTDYNNLVEDLVKLVSLIIKQR